MERANQYQLIKGFVFAHLDAAQVRVEGEISNKGDGREQKNH